MSKNDIADKLAQGVRRALHPSTSKPAPDAPPATTASPTVPPPRRPAAHSELHPARVWPD